MDKRAQILFLACVRANSSCHTCDRPTPRNVDVDVLLRRSSVQYLGCHDRIQDRIQEAVRYMPRPHSGPHSGSGALHVATTVFRTAFRKRCVTCCHDRIQDRIQEAVQWPTRAKQTFPAGLTRHFTVISIYIFIKPLCTDHLPNASFLVLVGLEQQQTPMHSRA